jgi:hypothetical protein
MLGARLLAGAQVRVLRLVFAVVIAALGAQMIWHGLSGSLEPCLIANSTSRSPACCARAC